MSSKKKQQIISIWGKLKLICILSKNENKYLVQSFHKAFKMIDRVSLTPLIVCDTLKLGPRKNMNSINSSIY